MLANLERGVQYVKQAQGRYLELKAALTQAEGGKPDWPTIRGLSRSLEANLDSAVSDLAEEPSA